MAFDLTAPFLKMGVEMLLGVKHDGGTDGEVRGDLEVHLVSGHVKHNASDLISQFTDAIFQMYF